MKMRYILHLAIVATLTIGCGESQEGMESPDSPTNSAVLFGAPSTRAAAVANFEQGDKIYIALSDDSDDRMVGTESLYSVTATNDIASTDPLYWIDDLLSFYAVNQKLEVSGDLLKYDLSTAEDELLWISLFDERRSDNETTPIALKFNRCLATAKVNVIFEGSYSTVNPDLNIYFKSNTAMEFDPWAATFEVENLSGKPTTNDDYATSWSSATPTSTTSYELLTLPQTIEALTEIWLVVEDSEGDKATRITAAAKDIELEAGCTTNINITIKRETNDAVVTMDSVTLIPFEQAEIESEDQTIIPTHV
ncbi:MAG: fimbrillin family protein [Rikenellaceae bacterium]